jgi:hypothetical protein
LWVETRRKLATGLYAGAPCLWHWTKWDHM